MIEKSFFGPLLTDEMEIFRYQLIEFCGLTQLIQIVHQLGV